MGSSSSDCGFCDMGGRVVWDEGRFGETGDRRCDGFLRFYKQNFVAEFSSDNTPCRQTRSTMRLCMFVVSPFSVFTRNKFWLSRALGSLLSLLDLCLFPGTNLVS